jgi:hypothetical protein
MKCTEKSNFSSSSYRFLIIVQSLHLLAWVGSITLINRYITCFSLSPYSFDVSPSCTDTPHVTHDSIPIGAIPIFASSTPEYQDAVSRVISGANTVYQEFVKSEEGHGFNGQICFVGKC